MMAKMTVDRIIVRSGRLAGPGWAARRAGDRIVARRGLRRIGRQDSTRPAPVGTESQRRNGSMPMCKPKPAAAKAVKKVAKKTAKKATKKVVKK
jgi:hypothetical protein